MRGLLSRRTLTEDGSPLYESIWRVTPKQEWLFLTLIDSPPRNLEVCFKGANQSGKSHLGAMWCAYSMAAHPDENFLIVVPKYESFDEGAGQRLKQAYPFWGKIGSWSELKHVYEMPQGGCVYVETAERPIETLTAHRIWIDEPGMISRARYEDCVSRRSATGGPILMTGTPRSSRDWYARWEMDARRGNNPLRILVEASQYENPAIGLDTIEEARRVLSTVEFERRILGKSVSAEGLVFPDFSFDDEVTGTPGYNMCGMPSDKRLASGCVWCGIDPGYSSAFAACWVLMEQRGEGADAVYHYILFDEMKRQEMTDPECADMIVASEFAPLVNRYVVDSGDPKFAELLRAKLKAAGYTRALVELVQKRRLKDRDFLPWSVDRMRVLINTRRLRVVRGRCEDTLEELALYRYPEPKDDKRPTEIPIGVNDHIISAIRYVLATATPEEMRASVRFPRHLGARGERNPRAVWKLSPKMSFEGVPLVFSERRRGPFAARFAR